MLGTTFEIASKTRIFRGRYTLQEYQTFNNKVGSHIMSEQMAAMEVNRFNCPYVLLTIFHHPQRDWPTGRGGTWNGGFNTGGGIALMSSRAFTHLPNGQSTLQHELGHAFGQE